MQHIQLRPRTSYPFIRLWKYSGASATGVSVLALDSHNQTHTPQRIRVEALQATGLEDIFHGLRRQPLGERCVLLLLRSFWVHLLVQTLDGFQMLAASFYKTVEKCECLSCARCVFWRTLHSHCCCSPGQDGESNDWGSDDMLPLDVDYLQELLKTWKHEFVYVDSFIYV